MFRGRVSGVGLVVALAAFVVAIGPAGAYVGGGLAVRSEARINDLFVKHAAKALPGATVEVTRGRPGLMIGCPIVLGPVNVAALLGRAAFHAEVSVTCGETTNPGIAWMSVKGAAVKVGDSGGVAGDCLAVYQIATGQPMPTSAQEAADLYDGILPASTRGDKAFRSIRFMGKPVYVVRNVEVTTDGFKKETTPWSRWLPKQWLEKAHSVRGKRVTILVVPDPNPPEPTATTDTETDDGEIPETETVDSPALVIFIVGNGGAAAYIQ